MPRWFKIVVIVILSYLTGMSFRNGRTWLGILGLLAILVSLCYSALEEANSG